VTGLLAVEMLKGAWAFVRRNWQAIALTGVVLAAGYAGWRGRGEWDAGKIRAAETATAEERAAREAAERRVGEYAAGEAGYREAIATLRAGDEERDRELAESQARAAAMEAAQRAEMAALLARHAARLEAQTRETASARYEATEALRALDELMLRWLEADPAAPPGVAEDLRRRGYGERTISGGG